MYRTFESIKNWQRYKCLNIFEIPGGNTPPTKFSRGDTSATLPNLNGRYQGTTCTSWLNFYTPCKSNVSACASKLHNRTVFRLEKKLQAYLVGLPEYCNTWKCFTYSLETEKGDFFKITLFYCYYFCDLPFANADRQT